MVKRFCSKVTVLLGAVFLLSGCVYKSNIDYGEKFTSEQVAKIEKKVTTKADLVKIFGEPSIKTVISETGEKWLYQYADASTSSQAFTMIATLDYSSYMLDILIENGIVVNFAETNKKHNMNMSFE